jgi:hypothetical protein
MIDIALRLHSVIDEDHLKIKRGLASRGQSV